ncbi:MAG: DUF4272 domain-containing protein [Labilithrix sp.]|nr:DUF4272 domain-containing protein [Labilithrix sp.]MCW5813233.1 DUF4272 domain-containing protein [Labilithrix sp.]
MTKTRNATDVARRCLCLELLAQRSLLESDEEEPLAGREAARAQWSSRIADLGVADTLSSEERALLDAPVGALSEDERDDLDGRSAGAAVLLWALGRAPQRPTFALADDVIAEHGLLGDGSISAARAAAEGATLRAASELDAAIASYRRARGKAKDPSDAEQIYAGIGAHHLEWIVDASMSFDDDLAT